MVFIFTFVNFCGGLASGCWGVPIFVELPMMILQGFLASLLLKVDPTLKARLRGGGAAVPVVVTHPTAMPHPQGVVPQLTVVGTPVQSANKV